MERHELAWHWMPSSASTMFGNNSVVHPVIATLISRRRSVPIRHHRGIMDRGYSAEDACSSALPIPLARVGMRQRQGLRPVPAQAVGERAVRSIFVTQPRGMGRCRCCRAWCETRLDQGDKARPPVFRSTRRSDRPRVHRHSSGRLAMTADDGPSPPVWTCTTKLVGGSSAWIVVLVPQSELPLKAGSFASSP